MGRFTNLPERLRTGAGMISCDQPLELGKALGVAGTMEDAALKIEALEREVRRLRDTKQ